MPSGYGGNRGGRRERTEKNRQKKKKAEKKERRKAEREKRKEKRKKKAWALNVLAVSDLAGKKCMFVSLVKIFHCVIFFLLRLPANFTKIYELLSVKNRLGLNPVDHNISVYFTSVTCKQNRELMVFYSIRDVKDSLVISN